MISLIVVNFNSYDFLELLVESINIFSKIDYELIVVDNSYVKQNISGNNIKVFTQENNIGHGAGLNLGVKQAKFPYIMFLDVDVHFLKHNWEDYFLRKIKHCDVIGAKGVESKPIRPACMFLKKEFASYDWNSTPGYKGHRITPDGFDVAIKAYHEMIKDNVKIEFMESYQNRYKTITGEEWGLENTSLCYHHWHASHLKERQIDFPEDNLIENKKKLFNNIPWRIL